MHDLNSEIWLDARGDFGWMRARARGACLQPARLLISRALWLLNARPVAKTDALIWESTVHRTTFTPKYKLNSYQIKMNELRW